MNDLEKGYLHLQLETIEYLRKLPDLAEIKVIKYQLTKVQRHVGLITKKRKPVLLKQILTIKHEFHYVKCVNQIIG